MTWARVSCLVLVWVASPLASCRAQGATATPTPPAAQPGNVYFPSTNGCTWKFLVTETRDGKTQRPYVQTLKSTGPLDFKGLSLLTIGDDLYLTQPDGVYLYAHRSGAEILPLADMQKIIPSRLRAGEAWNVSAKADGGYSTCLGSRTIKTGAREFNTQCVYVTSSTGDDGTPLKETYRYFARDVGLVRETVSEKTRSSDATPSYTMSRDLVAFTPAETARPAQAPPRLTPLNCIAAAGVLLDPAGQAMAQTTLTLRRTDKEQPGLLLQTDLQGRFKTDGLDPAASYELAASIAGYEPLTMALHSEDAKPADVTLRLAAATTREAPKDDAFSSARKLAAGGKHTEALAKYSDALKVDPKNGSILAYRALSRLALGQSREAQTDVEDALKLNDKDPTIWEAAGQVKLAQNQLAQGRSLFEKAAHVAPKSAGAIYTDLAAALSSKNDPKLAGDIESALKSAARADPPSPEATFQLGQAYADAGNQDGRAYLQKYVELAAKLPEADRDPQKVQLAKQLIRALDVVKSLGR